MSVESSSATWDAIAFWLAVAGTVVLFVSGVSSIAARRYARKVAAEKELQSQREKTVHEQSLANLKVDLAEAIARGEEAKRAAAEATARAAEANEKAEHERLERRKIEKKLAPRALNSLQYDTLIKFFKLVATGANADICSCTVTPEVIGITTQLLQLLRDSGWRITPWPWLRSDRVIIGILVESDPKDRASTIIANGLVQQLRDIGELLAVHEPMTNREKLDAPMRITVGTQPL